MPDERQISEIRYPPAEHVVLFRSILVIVYEVFEGAAPNDAAQRIWNLFTEYEKFRTEQIESLKKQIIDLVNCLPPKQIVIPIGRPEE